MHFGEYELFPSLIGLSPLPTAHLNTFQRISVRYSIPCYRNFNLAMGRSQGFASTPTDYCALLRLAFASASNLKFLTLPMRSNSQDHYAKGTPSPVGFDRLQTHGFRIFFTPLFRVLFTFPSRYSFAIGLSGVFSLTRWFWQIQTGFHMSRHTQDTGTLSSISCTRLSLLTPRFPTCSTILLFRYSSPTTPKLPKQSWFGLFPLRSPLLRKSLLFSSPAPTQMFQFSAFAPFRVIYLQYIGFPHS